MVGVDFDYGCEKSFDELAETDSAELMVERVQDFRSENIESQYAELIGESFVLDSEGGFSKTKEPAIMLRIGDSSLLEALHEDEANLRGNPDGAVMHAYNAGRGVKRGVEELLLDLEDLGMNNVYLELEDSEVSVYEEEFGRNTVKEVAMHLQERGTDASKNMVTGLFAAYAEDEYLLE